MKKITTLFRIVRLKFLPALFIFTMLSFIKVSTNAQNICPNETSLFVENFGTGTTPTSHPDVIPTALVYQATGPLAAEGVYRVINNTQQKPEWHASPDHTGNTDGKMLVVNGQASTFYTHILTNASGFSLGAYSASLHLMNLNKLPTCGVHALLPTITFTIEYQEANNSWVSLGGSPVTVASVPQTVVPTWVFLGGIFTLPATGNFVVQNIRLTLKDGIIGGCGNDYALDDIKFSSCPSGGTTPVQFLSIYARQKVNGITVSWSTASETNNKYFDVEKSIDGGLNWTLVSTTQTIGNSNVTRNYSAYDSRPFAGTNYYRIKQVDIDGRYKYSVTASVNLVIKETSASVLPNPVINEIAIDFLSKANQNVLVALFDMTGKQVAVERITIPKGSSRKPWAKTGNLQRGIYILNIKDESGELIYNGKLVKQ